jgi:hypothetical protein
MPFRNICLMSQHFSSHSTATACFADLITDEKQELSVVQDANRPCGR